MTVSRCGVISWAFAAVFFVTGVLNLFLVHAVPGIFYVCLSVLYLPATGAALRGKLGITVPFWVKVVFGLVILWGTLAVGDLAEVLGL